MVRIWYENSTNNMVCIWYELNTQLKQDKKCVECGTNMVRTWYEQHRRIWYEYGTNNVYDCGINVVRIMATGTLNVPFKTHGASR